MRSWVVLKKKVYFETGALCIPEWSITCHISMNDLELLVSPSKSCTPITTLGFVVLGDRTQGLWMVAH